MSMLAEIVEVVIGVDTHKHTHTAAVIDATTGAVLDQLTVATDPDGYAERRRAEGKTDREIRRCLKRYIARQLYRHLETGPPTP